MQFIFLKTKRQLFNKVLELQKENKEIRETVNFFKRQYDCKTIQLKDRNDTIRDLEKKIENLKKQNSKDIFYSGLEYKAKLKEKNDIIKFLEGQLEHEKNTADGYKKAYEELKETTKETNFTIKQINADVWKLIKGKTFQETHKCTEECFVKHVIPAIQRDYDSINPKYKENAQTIDSFLTHWEKRLGETYDFIEGLYVFHSQIKVKFK